MIEFIKQAGSIVFILSVAVAGALAGGFVLNIIADLVGIPVLAFYPIVI